MAFKTGRQTLTYPSPQHRIQAALTRLSKQMPGYYALDGMGLTTEDLDEIISGRHLDDAIVLQIDSPPSSFRQLSNLQMLYLSGRQELRIPSGFLPRGLVKFVAPHSIIREAQGLAEMIKDANKVVHVGGFSGDPGLPLNQPNFRVNGPAILR